MTGRYGGGGDQYNRSWQLSVCKVILLDSMTW